MRNVMSKNKMNNQIIKKMDNIINSYEIIDYYYPTPLPEWKRSDEYLDLLNYLETLEELNLFNERMQYIGTSARRITIKDLCDWLILRAKDTTPQEAYSNLSDYIENDSFVAYAIMILSGLYVDDNFSLGDEIEIIKPTTLNNKHLQLSLFKNEQNILPLLRVDSILRIPVKHKKLHLKDGGSDSYTTVTIETYKKLNDIRLLFSLLSNSRGPQSIGYSLIVDDSIPNLLGGYSWSINSYRNPIMCPPLIEMEANNIKSLYYDFSNLDHSVQTHLRIALKYLNSYFCSNDIIQKSIDLRVCMESIFLDGIDQELGFRLRLRAAFLETDIDKRSNISTLFKKAYAITSRAVHNGQLSDKKKKEANTIFPDAVKIIKNTILLIMKKGKIDWEAVELNGRLDT